MTKNLSRPVPCSIEGCEKPYYARSWCKTHYERWYIHSNPNRPARVLVPCSIEGCEKPKLARGWCKTHYNRWREHGEPTPAGLRTQAPKGAPDVWIAQALESQTDECMPWPFCTQFGYGVLRNEGRTLNAHRMVLMLATGEDGAGLDAAHAPGICHNRLCCNPRHLRWATRAENVADTLIDDTHHRGERNHTAKLSESDVLAIRVDDRPDKAIAADYGVNPTTVGHVKARRTWAWLEDGAA